MTKRTPLAGGFFLIGAMMIGFGIGVARGTALAGTLIGLALGSALALALYVFDRRRIGR